MKSANNNKPTIPPEVAEFAAREYSKAYLYSTLFIHAYQQVTNALLECGAYNRELIGKDREVERAFDNYDNAMKKNFGMCGRALLEDFDKYNDVFNKILEGKYKIKLDNQILNLKTI